MARQFHFLSLNSIAVRYCFHQSKDNSMSDLLDFAVSQQQVQAKLTMNEESVYLSQKSGYLFPQDRSPVQHAFLKYVYLDTHLLDKVGSYYPEIKDLRLLNCRLQKQDVNSNRCIIDLCKFKNLQRFELTVTTLDPLYFQCVHGSQEERYIYDQTISVCGIHPVELTENIPKNREIIKIITAVELETFVFNSA